MTDLQVVSIVAPLGVRDTHHGIPLVQRVESLKYDRAITFDDVEGHSRELTKGAGIPFEKRWLI